MADALTAGRLLCIKYPDCKHRYENVTKQGMGVS
jgi:hypothetical protein